MKKVTLYIAFSIFLINGILSQITITQQDMTVIGQKYTYKDSQNINLSTGLQPGSSGANQVWDFLSENYLGEDSIGVSDPSTLQNGNTFASANQAYTPILTSSIFIDMGFAEINSNSASLEFLGKTPPAYMDPTAIWKGGFTLLQFPSTYLSGFNTGHLEEKYTTSKAELWGPVEGPLYTFLTPYINTYLHTSSLMDGYGVVKTQGGTYNCLRQAFFQYRVDSIKGGVVYMYPKDTVIRDTVKIYKWWAQGIGMPVFELRLPNKFMKYTESRYLEGMITTGIADEKKKMEDLVIYPNPSNGNLHIKLPLASNSTCDLLVFNAVGQVAFSGSVDSMGSSIDLSGLDNGIYLAQLKNKNEVMGSARIVIQK